MYNGLYNSCFYIALGLPLQVWLTFTGTFTWQQGVPLWGFHFMFGTPRRTCHEDQACSSKWKLGLQSDSHRASVASTSSSSTPEGIPTHFTLPPFVNKEQISVVSTVWSQTKLEIRKRERGCALGGLVWGVIHLGRSGCWFYGLLGVG